MEKEKAFIEKVIAQLKWFAEKNPEFVEDGESLEVAQQCLSMCFKGVEAPAEGNSQLFDLFLGSDLLHGNPEGIVDAPESEERAMEDDAEPAAEEEIETPFDKELNQKFRSYLEVLEKRGYFHGADKGTPQYREKYEKAFSRFKTRYGGSNGPDASSSSSLSSSSSSSSSTDQEQQKVVDEEKKEEEPVKEVSEEDRAEAERLKGEGNKSFIAGQLEEAVEFYSQAIDKNPTNAMFYGNRAAAYTKQKRYQEAIQDCKKAVSIDPNYVKGYSRLGLALVEMGSYQEALDSGYLKALELDPSNPNVLEAIQKTKELLNASASVFDGLSGANDNNNEAGDDSPAAAGGMPDLSSLFGGGTGGNPAGAGGGGMPDLSSLLGGGGGGGAPDLSALLNNPQIAQAAQSMMQNPQMREMAMNMMQNPDLMKNFMGGNQQQ